MFGEGAGSQEESIYHRYSDEFLQCLLRADRAEALSRLRVALSEGCNAEQLLLRVLQPSLDEIGGQWSRQRASLSQVYVAGKIADDAVNMLIPLLPAKAKAAGKVVIGTIAGDYHGLGRKIVGAFLRAGGFEIIDLGLGVTPEEYVAAAVREQAQLVAVSALMLHTTSEVARIRPLLDQSGHEHVKLVVGGAPFNFDRQLYSRVGADATARHAGEAMAVVRHLLNEE